jgi:hypothetical protein
MSLSPDGDINARAIEFALMRILKVKTGTWTKGRVQVAWCVLLLLGIPVCAEASVGRARSEP